jgi:diguanylate cyclase (GGDEF)-like protein
MLDVIARELGGPLRMAMLVEEAQHAATTDPLTGLPNRRAFLAALDIEQARSERHGYSMSLLLLDVDHFKSINDTHGHAAGDRVLAALGQLLVREVRKTDIVGRWGGEEFVAVLSGADEPGARIGAERIRAAIEAMQVRLENGQLVPVRASIGVSCLEVRDTPEILIGRADSAMYQAKSAGRNRIAVAASVLRRTGTELAVLPELQ